MTAPIVEMDGLVLETRAVREVARPVDGIDLAIAPGEAVGLVGESGSGKSLTALAMAGLLPPGIRIRSGRIRFDGRDIVEMHPRELRALRGPGMALLCQEPMSAFNPVVTIGRQMTRVIRRHRRLTRSRARATAIEWLGDVGIDSPAACMRLYPHELSGGMLQRVMLAMAASCRPRLLIADEPTAAVDTVTQAGLLRLLRELRDELGTAMLLISHDLGVVGDLCSRTLVMQAGRIVESASTEALLRAPAHPYTQRLLESVPVIGPGQQERKMSRRQPLLEVDDLQVCFRAPAGGMFRAVDGASLQLGRGQSLGLVGRSGCGKSTLARALVGLHASSRGSIRLEGHDVSWSSLAERRAMARRIQIIFQDVTGALSPRRTVAQMLREPMDSHRIGTRADRRNRAVELLEQVGLGADALERYPHEFSGGQRQRLSLAWAMILQPDILVADEPVSALDVVVQDRILALFEGIQRRYGTALLFISHDLAVVSRLCERVAVMDRGRIVEAGPVERICSRPEHDRTRELLSAVPALQQSPA